MNWEAISAIGEITGALAVVLTLGYFGIQVRAAREAAAAVDAAEAAAAQEAADL